MVCNSSDCMIKSATMGEREEEPPRDSRFVYSIYCWRGNMWN